MGVRWMYVRSVQMYVRSVPFVSGTRAYMKQIEITDTKTRRMKVPGVRFVSDSGVQVEIHERVSVKDDE